MIDARLLALLCCPCGGALRQIGEMLSCGECGGHYPVIGGIPRFSPRAEAGQAQVAEAFGYKWRRAAGFGMSGETEAVMQDWLLDLRGWQNETEYADFLSPFRTILDAGSGNGRDLAQIARLRPDALTVGIEISAAIDVAAENVKHLPNVLLVQGDICRPPLKPGSFDYVTSNGVLHHTPNTKEAMRSVLSLLAPGGQLAFTLYRKKAPIREFTDDYVRREIRNMTPAEAWREMESVTLLGKALSDFRAEIEIPDVKVLGMQGGRHNLQRFLYYTVLKCYWRELVVVRGQRPRKLRLVLPGVCVAAHGGGGPKMGGGADRRGNLLQTNSGPALVSDAATGVERASRRRRRSQRRTWYHPRRAVLE